MKVIFQLRNAVVAEPALVSSIETGQCRGQQPTARNGGVKMHHYWRVRRSVTSPGGGGAAEKGAVPMEKSSLP